MARRTASTGRQSHGQNSRNARSMYVYGNTVAKPDYEPRQRTQRKKQSKKVSRQVKKNRNKALHMSKGYVLFLSVAAVVALVVCVNYVMIQSRITARANHISRMQEELASLKEENNTRYNVVMSSVNLEDVRERAVNGLSMVNASPEQVIEYTNPVDSYVKQYEEIPKDGVLAGSNKVNK